jgi:hypothetical protein
MEYHYRLIDQVVQENIVKAKEEKLKKKEEREMMLAKEAKKHKKKENKSGSTPTSSKKRQPLTVVGSSIDVKAIKGLTETAVALQTKFNSDKMLLLRAFAGELEEMFAAVDPEEEVFSMRKFDFMSQLETPRSLLPSKLVNFVENWVDKSLLNQADAKVADDAASFLLHALIQAQASRVGIRLLIQALATRRPLSLLKRVADIKSKYMTEYEISASIGL